MKRAKLRLRGAENILSLVAKDHLIPSVRYAILCGWQGLLTSRPRTRLVSNSLLFFHQLVCIAIV